MSCRLSKQLSMLTNLSSRISSASGRSGKLPPLLKLTCKQLQVGKLGCSSATPCDCYDDRLEYFFQHPDEGRVRMIMYFRDIDAVTIDMAACQLSFHVKTQLKLFAGIYNPADQDHLLVLHFCSFGDVQTFRSVILPCMSSDAQVLHALS